MSDYRVTVDRCGYWLIGRSYGLVGSCMIETYRPTNLKARLWRWLLGG